MKKLIYVILLCVSFTANAQVSWKETIKIYDKLIKVNHLKRPVVLRLIMTDELNAWASPDNSVNITLYDLKVLTKAEMAFVLGHELAHLQFNDTHTQLSGTIQEDRADKYGAIWAENIGYSRCKQSYFFIRLYKLYGNLGDQGDPHSKNLKRFWSLYKYCKLI